MEDSSMIEDAYMHSIDAVKRLETDYIAIRWCLDLIIGYATYIVKCLHFIRWKLYALAKPIVPVYESIAVHRLPK